MAYPMVKWPRFSEFRQRLEHDFACRYVADGKISINGEPIARLERDVNGSTRRYAVTYSEDDEIAPSVVRSICDHLLIGPEAFGLNIG